MENNIGLLNSKTEKEIEENILFEGNEEQIMKRRKILEGKKYCGMGEHRRLYEMRGPKNNIKIASCPPPS